MLYFEVEKHREKVENTGKTGNFAVIGVWQPSNRLAKPESATDTDVVSVVE